MTTEEIREASRLWLAREGKDPSWEQLWDLCNDDPENAWLVIQEIAAHEMSDDLKALFAAGPIEDLLAKHGAVFIDRIEAKAESDSQFNYLLGGVWKSSMVPDVWDRIQKVRNNVW